MGNVLTEKRWSYTISKPVASRFRNAIDMGDYDELREVLKLSYKEIADNLPDYFDQDEYEEKVVDIDMLDEDEDEFDFELGELYDLCDNIGCFIPVIYDESAEPANEKTLTEGAEDIEKDIEAMKEALTDPIYAEPYAGERLSWLVAGYGSQANWNKYLRYFMVDPKYVVTPIDGKYNWEGSGEDDYYIVLKKYSDAAKFTAYMDQILADEEAGLEERCRITARKKITEPANEKETAIKVLQSYAKANPNVKDTVLSIAEMIKGWDGKEIALAESKMTCCSKCGAAIEADDDEEVPEDILCGDCMNGKSEELDENYFTGYDDITELHIISEDMAEGSSEMKDEDYDDVDDIKLVSDDEPEISGKVEK